MLVFSVCSILMDKFHGNSVRNLILKHGYGLNLLLMQMVRVVKHESDMLPIHSRESVVKLWSMGDGWITMWLFIKIPEAPVTIGCSIEEKYMNPYYGIFIVRVFVVQRILYSSFNLAYLLLQGSFMMNC